MTKLNECHCGGRMMVLKTVRAEGQTHRTLICSDCHSAVATVETALDKSTPEVQVAAVAATPSRAYTKAQLESYHAQQLAYEQATFGRYILDESEKIALKAEGKYTFVWPAA